MRFDVGIGPQSLPYGLLKEIMDHPCLDGGPRSNKIGCTKFCEGYTKSSKVNFEVGINPQSLPYGFQNEIMDHPCSDGGPGSNRIKCTIFDEGCTKFNEGYAKFCEGCIKVSKMHYEVGIDP